MTVETVSDVHATVPGHDSAPTADNRPSTGMRDAPLSSTGMDGWVVLYIYFILSNILQLIQHMRKMKMKGMRIQVEMWMQVYTGIIITSIHFRLTLLLL